jgi:hypothetical protein
LVYMVIIAVLTRILDKIESRFDYYR